MTHFTAVQIDSDNVGAACRIQVREDQQQFVAPVAHSLAEAFTQPDVAWPRLVLDGDRPVAFVMAAFDPDSPVTFFRSGIWRLNVDAGAQRSGAGTFAVRLVLDEARRRGFAEATVLWELGEGGPGPFYERLGFRDTGERCEGEVVGAISL